MTADEFADFIRGAIKDAIAPLAARLATIDAAVGDVKAHTVEEVKATRDALLSLTAKVAAVEARPPVPGPPGPAGTDGRDGLGVADLDATLADRVLTLSFTNGPITKAIPIELTGLPLHRGVYAEASTYAVGDLVTYDGSIWHCQTPTIGHKPGTSPDWRLIVKRGRDGRDRA